MLSNCKFGAKVLISKVGSNVRAQERSVDGRFRELLTDFRGQSCKAIKELDEIYSEKKLELIELKAQLKMMG